MQVAGRASVLVDDMVVPCENVGTPQSGGGKLKVVGTYDATRPTKTKRRGWL